MFAGTLTKTADTAAAAFTGMIHSTRFDIAIQLEARTKMSERSPDFDVTAVNTSGRKVRIGTAWNETGNTTGNPYLSMQIDVGLGPFRVNAVQSKEAREAQSGDYEIIPLVSNRTMKSGSISGELTAMDADNAFAGYVANMMFDLDFMLIENVFKTEETHPDYRIEVSSPKGHPIRVGSAWMAKSNRTGNDYVSLLINTPDGDLRVNAVQNEEQRGGQTFSIIPFVESADQERSENTGLALVSWGSTYGAIYQAVKRCRARGLAVSQVHIRHLNPFPRNLGELLAGYDQILVPELNAGQLVKILRSEYLVPAEGYNKVAGRPFTIAEIEQAIDATLSGGAA